MTPHLVETVAVAVMDSFIPESNPDSYMKPVVRRDYTVGKGSTTRSSTPSGQRYVGAPCCQFSL